MKLTISKEVYHWMIDNACHDKWHKDIKNKLDQYSDNERSELLLYMQNKINSKSYHVLFGLSLIGVEEKKLMNIGDQYVINLKKILI